MTVGVVFAVLGVLLTIVGVNAMRTGHIDLGTDELGPHHEEGTSARVWGLISTIIGISFFIFGAFVVAVRLDYFQ